MDEKQFDRALRSVGMSCFTNYFDVFASNLPREEVVERLKRENPFTEKSCNSRTSHARSIIANGYAKEALVRVAMSNSSRVSDSVRSAARAHLEQL
ncbi:TPA: hypothetical protein NJ909_000119 [Vibrio parahaemolyticus]|nr:hypothetical protein [Vibrio parahaemolyticus]